MSWRKNDEEGRMPDLRLGNVFQLPSRRISRRWTRSGTTLVIFLEALCGKTNLFWRENIYWNLNTRRENFRTFEERDILNGIKSDWVPAKKTSLRGIVLPVKAICTCVPSWTWRHTQTKNRPCLKGPCKGLDSRWIFLQIILRRYPAHATGLAREKPAKFAPVHIS